MRKIAVLSAAAGILALALGGCTVLESTYVKKVSEADNLARELASLQQKHKDLTFENSMLKARVANLSSERDKLAGGLTDMTAQREKLAADLAYTTGQRDKAEADNRNLEGMLKAKSDSLSQAIIDLRLKVSGLEGENGRLKQQAAGLEAERDRLRQEVATLQKAQVEKVEKVSRTYEDLLEKMKGEISKGQVTISELKGKLTVNMVDAILFDSGKAEVKPEGQAVLQKVISILKEVKDKAIRTEGHTDNVPIIGLLAKRYATNWELSAARAINVTRYLQDQGIDPAVLSAAAYGEHRPVADNGSAEGKAKNRRIEIILVPRE